MVNMGHAKNNRRVKFEMSDKMIAVKVAVRCRPLISKEINEGCTTCLQFVPGEPQVLLGTNRAFTYDYVFGPAAAQEVVYKDAVSGLANSIFKGYNATVLAYGQTGSGKTFSMGGNYDILNDSTNNDILGVIPRVVQDLFLGISERPEFEFSVRVSYLELYKEDIFDLLVPPNKRDKDAVVIREEISGGIRLHGLKEITVVSAEETLDLLEKGATTRTVGSTAMNNSSSRSHAIFTIHIDRTNKKDSQDFCKAKFHLVDLAGSERQKKTQAEGERFKEGVNINKGLLALGNVISALGDEAGKKGHIPYRDSKLTRLLQDSLGGNSHTLMIACVSPADSNMEETLSTLRYADRARKIKNKPIVNRDPQAAEIMRLRALVQQLQVQTLQAPQVLVNTSHGEERVDMYKIKEENEALLMANKKLTLELEEAIDQNAAMCEKLILVEAARDAFHEKLEALKQKAEMHMSKLNATHDLSTNETAQEQLRAAEEIHKTILELEEDESMHDAEDVNSAASAETSPADSTCSVEEAEQAFTMKRARLGRELTELNKVLEKKEWLAKQMVASETQLTQIKNQYEDNMKKLEGEVSKLQNERQDLQSQLSSARSNPAANKVAEQRRKRLKELEEQISQLKKKQVEQSKMLKLKEQKDKECEKLNNEIKAMKQARVRLVKQMKEEAEQFRKWKQETDKQVIQLKAKDRKRQIEMVKMEQKFSRQETVLRRKAEQAEASKNRLKEALDRQKKAREDREKRGVMGDQLSQKERLKKWVSGDLELAVRLEETRQHLQTCINDRTVMTKQLAELRNRLLRPTNKKKRLNDSSTQETSQREEIVSEIQELEKQIECNNAQISDIQQKLMDADQEDRARTRWLGIHSLVEGKMVMNQLFNVVAVSCNPVCLEETPKTLLNHFTASKIQEETRVQTQAVSSRVGLDKKKSEFEENLKSLEEAQNTLKEAKQISEKDIHELREEYEAKMLLLLGHCNKDHQITDEELEKRLRIQDEEISQMASRIDVRDEKYKEAKYGRVQLMPDFDTPSSKFFSPDYKPPKVKKAAVKRKSSVSSDEDEVFESEDEEADTEEQGVVFDPDWAAGNTPGMRHPIKIMKKAKKRQPRRVLQKSVSQGMRSSTDSMNSTRNKTMTDVSVIAACGCKKNVCKDGRCKCVKQGAVCGDACKCDDSLCKNRETQLPESTTSETSEVMNGTFVLDGSDASAEATALDTTFSLEPKVLQPILTDNSNRLNKSEDDFALPKRGRVGDSVSKSEPDSSSIVDLETTGINRKRKLYKTKFFDGI